MIFTDKETLLQIVGKPNARWVGHCALKGESSLIILSLSDGLQTAIIFRSQRVYGHDKIRFPDGSPCYLWSSAFGPSIPSACMVVQYNYKIVKKALGALDSRWYDI